ncbi:MAG: hypothetical protein ACREFP_25405, partial [Acetobacteraceae bacterium]
MEQRIPGTEPQVRTDPGQVVAAGRDEARTHGSWLHFFAQPEFGPLLLLIIEIAIFQSLQPEYLS